MPTGRSQLSFGKPGFTMATRLVTFTEAGKHMHQHARAESRSTGASGVASDVPVPEAVQHEANTSARRKPFIYDELRAGVQLLCAESAMQKFHLEQIEALTTANDTYFDTLRRDHMILRTRVNVDNQIAVSVRTVR